MSDRQVTEKEEEKRGEKEEKEEKSWDEKVQRDPLSALVWAAILIWAGLVLLGGNLGLLTPFERVEPWSLIAVGAGLIVLLEVVVRLLVPDYRRPVAGSIVFAIILLAIGLGELVSWERILPFALIIIGLSIVLRGFLRRR